MPEELNHLVHPQPEIQLLLWLYSQQRNYSELWHNVEANTIGSVIEWVEQRREIASLVE